MKKRTLLIVIVAVALAVLEPQVSLWRKPLSSVKSPGMLITLWRPGEHRNLEPDYG